jgi:hypothetical protein
MREARRKPIATLAQSFNCRFPPNRARPASDMVRYAKSKVRILLTVVTYRSPGIQAMQNLYNSNQISNWREHNNSDQFQLRQGRVMNLEKVIFAFFIVFAATLARRLAVAVPVFENTLVARVRGSFVFLGHQYGS